MVKIFAKHGTDEKVLVVCQQQEVRDIQARLAEKFGGNWLWVDKVHAGEILHFKDELLYLGFHGRNERYCSGIENLRQ